MINKAQSAYLDMVRGLAAQLVLVHHAASYAWPGPGVADWGGGALGVLIFFLLSGFLITHTIQSRLAGGRFSLTEFTVSRATRIYLPYLPALILVAVLDRFSVRFPVYEHGADFNTPTALANVCMMQDFPLFQILRRLHVPEQAWFFKTFGSGRQFWTVSIEWWIYITAGLLTFMLLRRPSPVLLVLLGLAAIEPVYNLVGGPGDSLTLFWLMGAAASVALARAWTPWGPGCALAWAGLLILAGVRLFFTHGRIYDAVFALILAGLLYVPFWALSAHGSSRAVQRTGLDHLAFHSYSLYLIHGSIVLALVAGWGMAGWRGLLTMVLMSNAAAIPFAYLFERPQARLRRAILGAIGWRRPAEAC